MLIGHVRLGQRKEFPCRGGERKAAVGEVDVRPPQGRRSIGQRNISNGQGVGGKIDQNPKNLPI
ncbi:unnamed protein product [Linum tenue]|uniref:Uncharacterized protein n=1 Tax=Linum tenue TaxID=586396 RepID=A0AAV0S178_9ROSI|nr:unnamed protein product [Linum tenue]